MNNEKLARKNIQNCINFELGGYENTLLDYPEDAEEYINAKTFLADHKAIVDYIYDCSVSAFYVEGGVFTDARLISQIKFLGKEKLLTIVEELVSKEGYWNLGGAHAPLLFLLWYTDNYCHLIFIYRLDLYYI